MLNKQLAINHQQYSRRKWPDSSLQATTEDATETEIMAPPLDSSRSICKQVLNQCNLS